MLSSKTTSLFCWLLSFLCISAPCFSQVEIDHSAIPLFWEIVDTLANEQEPSTSLWQKFETHPAYAQIQQSGNRVSFLKKVLPLVFMPSKAEKLQKVISGKESPYQYFAAHLVDIKANRKILMEYLETGEFEDYKYAYRKSLKYLPPDLETEKIELTIYFALFEDNGFGGRVITMDLLHLYRGSKEENIDFFAHEFHHALRRKTKKYRLYAPESNSQYPIIEALNKIPLEGVASRLDKSKYFDINYYSGNPSMDHRQLETVEEFQSLVKEAPVQLAQIDAILSSKSTAEEKGKQIFQQLPWSGHVIGFYMSKAIEQAYSKKALIKAQYSCIKFFLLYQKAAKRNKELYQFSRESIAILRGLRGLN